MVLLIKSMPAEMSPPWDAGRVFVKWIYVYVCPQTGRPFINLPQDWSLTRLAKCSDILRVAFKGVKSVLHI